MSIQSILYRSRRTQISKGASRLIASLAVAGTVGFFLGAAEAEASQAGEAFVQSTVQRGFELLNDTRLTQQEKNIRFRDFLLSVTDMQGVALYTLGRTRRTTSEADQNAFVEAFRDYALALYGNAFETYRSRSLRVTGSIERSPGDELVKTVVTGEAAAKRSDEIEVGFRIKGDDAHFKIVDLVVEGIGFASSKQNEFSGFLARSDNDVRRLTAMLKARARGSDAPKNVAENTR